MSQAYLSSEVSSTICVRGSGRRTGCQYGRKWGKYISACNFNGQTIQAGGKVAISFEHPDRKTFGDEDVQESSSSLIYIKKSFPTKKAVEDI